MRKQRMDVKRDSRIEKRQNTGKENGELIRKGRVVQLSNVGASSDIFLLV